MKKSFYVFLLILFLFGSFLAGSWYREQQPVRSKALGVKLQSVNDEPNTVTDTDTGFSLPGSSPVSIAPGTVRITPEKQQMIGVRTGVVKKTAMERSVRTVGRITPDEKRIYRLVAGIDGWIRETYSNDTGTIESASAG